jgi:hypothetical protein
MGEEQDEDPEDVYPEEYDGPTVRIPRVDVPTVEVPTDGSDAISDSPIVAIFVLQVVVWNAILLCFSLGVMFVYFRGDWETGRTLIGASVVLALYSAYRWPRGD